MRKFSKCIGIGCITMCFVVSTIFAQNNVPLLSMVPASVTSVIQGWIQNILGIRSDQNSELSQAVLIDRVLDPVTGLEINGTGSVTNFKIKNKGNSGKDFFVPLGTEKEWAAFLQNRPNDVFVCNEDSLQTQVIGIDAGNYSAQVDGCIDCIDVQGNTCQTNSACGLGGQCNFSQPPLYPNVIPKSICNGLAVNATQPGLYTPPPTGLVPDGWYEEDPVQYPISMQFPVNLGGNVRYLVGYQDSMAAATVMAATGQVTEWFDICSGMMDGGKPLWDPAVEYPLSNQPFNFWDHSHLRSCIFDLSPLSNPQAIARVWDLSTATCKEIISPSVGQCACSNASNNWNIGLWSACSVACGGGTQTRPVQCLDTQGNLAPESTCPVPKPVMGRMCNTHICDTNAHYDWVAGNWNNCSVACGAGVQTRDVGCYDLQNPLLGQVVDSLCVGQTKPSVQQTCNTQSCTGFSQSLLGHSQWTVSPWSVCSASCGGGDRTRTVLCEDLSTDMVLTDNNCSGQKPPETETCNTHPCITHSWVTSSWNSCSATCNGGTQSRTLTCQNNYGLNVANAFCTDPAPNVIQSCNTHNCSNNMVGTCDFCNSTAECPQDHFCDLNGSARCEPANGPACFQ